jgi:hypothetical protein
MNSVLASTWHVLEQVPPSFPFLRPPAHSPQTPPPTLREILNAYNSGGDGDRDMLLAMLNAKSAEDQVSTTLSLIHTHTAYLLSPSSDSRPSRLYREPCSRSITHPLRRTNIRSLIPRATIHPQPSAPNPSFLNILNNNRPRLILIPVSRPSGRHPRHPFSHHASVIAPPTPRPHLTALTILGQTLPTSSCHLRRTPRLAVIPLSTPHAHEHRWQLGPCYLLVLAEISLETTYRLRPTGGSIIFPRRCRQSDPKLSFGMYLYCYLPLPVSITIHAGKSQPSGLYKHRSTVPGLGVSESEACIPRSWNTWDPTF